MYMGLINFCLALTSCCLAKHILRICHLCRRICSVGKWCCWLGWFLKFSSYCWLWICVWNDQKCATLFAHFPLKCGTRASPKNICCVFQNAIISVRRNQQRKGQQGQFGWQTTGPKMHYEGPSIWHGVCKNITLHIGSFTLIVLLVSAQEGNNNWTVCIRIKVPNCCYEFGEFCVYKLIALHLCKPKWRNLWTKFTQLITGNGKLSDNLL